MSSYFALWPREALPKAREAAFKAVQLDDTLAEAHASLGLAIEQSELDIDAADREFRRAIELNPNYPSAHQWLSVTLSRRGHADEALAEARRAVELDPLGLPVNHNLALTLRDARRYDDAARQYRHTFDLDPTRANERFEVGITFYYAGNTEAAMKEFRTWADATTDRGLGEQMSEGLKVWKRAGPEAFFRFWASSLIKHSESEYFPASRIALIYAEGGDVNAAFEWLEKAIDEPDDNVLHLRSDPGYDKLRSDPRYEQLLKRLKLDR